MPKSKVLAAPRGYVPKPKSSWGLNLDLLIKYQEKEAIKSQPFTFTKCSSPKRKLYMRRWIKWRRWTRVSLGTIGLHNHRNKGFRIKLPVMSGHEYKATMDTPFQSPPISKQMSSQRRSRRWLTHMVFHNIKKAIQHLLHVLVFHSCSVWCSVTWGMVVSWSSSRSFSWCSQTDLRRTLLWHWP